MKALFWSAVLNGVVAVPVLVGLMVVVARKQIMQQFVAPASLRAFGWMATAVMAIAVAAMLATAG